MYLCQLKKKINKIKTTSIVGVKHKAKLNQSMHIQHIRLVNSVEGVCSPSLFHSIIVCSVRGKKDSTLLVWKWTNGLLCKEKLTVSDLFGLVWLDWGWIEEANEALKMMHENMQKHMQAVSVVALTQKKVMYYVTYLLSAPSKLIILFLRYFTT